MHFENTTLSCWYSCCMQCELYTECSHTFECFFSLHNSMSVLFCCLMTVLPYALTSSSRHLGCGTMKPQWKMRLPQKMGRWETFSGLILHGGNGSDCLRCPLSLPWCPWSAPVEIYNFLIGCPLPPRRKCLGALALSKKALHAFFWSLACFT